MNKGRRSLSNAPFGRFSAFLARHLPKICGRHFLVFPSEDSIKNDRFQLISRKGDFGCLVAIPLEVKESPERRFLSDVPFGWFPLATYPSGGFAAAGP